jgi:hypothetical protein
MKEATLVSETHQSNTIAALNSAMEEISSLRSQVESLQAAQGAMAGTLDSATSRVANCESTMQYHSQQLNNLNDSHSRRTDPVEVVAAVLKELALYCSVDRIYVADNQAPTRLEARAVVLHMRSTFHKWDTMVKVKQYLARHQVRDAAVRDCFPSAIMEVARNLNRYGGHLKRNQGVQRYRFIADRDGHPVLQTAKQDAGYTDHPVSVAEMESFLASLGANATQQPRQMTKGKTGPNHRAKNRGGQQMPSANHVPQGPIRQTLHLTQTANYGGQLAPAQHPHQQQSAMGGPDHAAQRALQDQYIQQQIVYQQQTSQHQQLHPQPLQMVQHQPAAPLQPGPQHQQLQYQQQFPALRPVVPQPGTDTAQ